MKDSQYFYIQGWMINRLELESKELIAYAMIYSYYRSGLETNASISYFAEIIGCSERTASNVLRGLEKKGFISKVLVHGRDGRNRNIYRINHQILVDKGVMQSDEELIKAEEKAEKPKNFTHQPEKISGDVGKNCMGHLKKLHVIILIYIILILIILFHSILRNLKIQKRMKRKKKQNQKKCLIRIF